MKVEVQVLPILHHWIKHCYLIAASMTPILKSAVTKSHIIQIGEVLFTSFLNLVFLIIIIGNTLGYFMDNFAVPMKRNHCSFVLS
ncbi:unnamed protein product [Ceutorhynchus assimilis]|uniref:Uncharacterized protein n=1 Tax=Ceutorhynchus assimilis TaxID=467358 RepID=A0A9N9MQN6_9CUCU|nr:unnamed protein product [Ceutorhynchus assimilis]